MAVSSNSPQTASVLIVGQGLAGSLLAWQMRRRGCEVRVVNSFDSASASRVAAGLINPVIGRRFSLAEDSEQMLGAALTAYREIGRLIGERVYRPAPLWRRIQDPAQFDRIQQRRQDPRFGRFFSQPPAATAADARLRDVAELIGIRHGGQLRTERLLDGLSAWLKGQNALLEQRFDHHELDVGAEALRWRGLNFSHVVFCEGHRAGGNPWFADLPLQPAQGEILTLRGARALPRGSISDGHWLVAENPRQCRVGANYQWRPLDRKPAAGVADELLEWSERQFKQPQDFEILDHRCGIRPGIRGGQPVLGGHPDDPRIVVFNGLGSRGSLYAPWYSALLADHLLTAKPLPAAVDVRRFDRQLRHRS